MKHIKRLVPRVRDWVFKHKYIVASFFILAFVFCLPNQTFAVSFPELVSDSGTFIVNSFLGLLLALTNLLVSLVGKLIVLLLGAIIIPILGYNNFGDSAVIAIGWPLVRDVVNMFVIVILLVIAIQTIVGYSKAKWEQQLPRLFIAVVLVNFSKMICLLVVDISQVVMFTFVNALRDIAAGNFMNLFQLNEFVSVNEGVSDIATAITNQSGMDMTNLLITSYATLSLLLMVLGTFILLTVVFVYRIVLLWVLIIISPIAFFLKGLEGIVSQASNYQKWWGMLSASATLGPVLTFFLWLGLAAASAGPIATSEGMNFEGTGEVPTLLAGVFATDKFLSVIIGMILIMVGFKIASESAGAMGGYAQKLITEDAGKKMFKGALTMPASYAYRGARGTARLGVAAGKKVGIEAGRQLAQTRAGQDLAKGVTQFGAAVAKEGPVGRFLGGAIMGAGGKLEGAVDASRNAAREKARGESASASPTELAGRVGSYFDKDGNAIVPIGSEAQARMEQDIISVATDEKKQEALKKEMTPEAFNKMMKQSLVFTENKKKDGDLTEDQEKALKKYKAKNLDVVAESMKDQKDERGNRIHSDADIKNAINKIISDKDFHDSDVSVNAVKNEHVREAMRDKKFTDKNGNEYSMLDRVRQGQGSISNEVRDALRDAERPDPTTALNTGSVRDIVSAMGSSRFDPNAITEAQVATPVRAEEIARAFVSAGKDINSITDATVRATLVSALGTVAGRADISTQERARIQNERMTNHRAAITDVVTIDPASGDVSKGDAALLAAMAKQNPDMIVNLSPHIDATRPNNTTQALARGYSKDMAKDLVDQYHASADPAEKAKIQSMLEQMKKAIKAESTRAAGDPDAVFSDKQIKEMVREINSARRLAETT